MNTQAKQIEAAVELIAQSAFELWRSKEFQELINFDTISQIEQDRIFNELEVTGLGLLAIQAEESLNPQLIDDAVERFLETLRSYSIEEEFIEQWQLLIASRLEEYITDYEEALVVAEEWKEFQEDEFLRMAWAKIETLTIDCVSNIRKDKITAEDPLWNIIRRWLVVLNGVILQKLHGAKRKKTSKKSSN